MKYSMVYVNMNTTSPVRKILILSIITLIIGFIGHFIIPRGLLIFYLFTHIGALGLLGLIGGVVGIIAIKKHRNFWAAFFLGCFMPIVSGFAAVILAGDSISCGGSISLAIGILFAIVYLFLKKKKPTISTSV